MSSNTNSNYYFDPKFKGYFECDRQEMIACIPKDTHTVLEIGCGAGAFGRILKQNRKVEVWGVEPDRNAAQHAEHFLDRVLVGLYPEDLDLPSQYFDCVVFNDVLEHMIDPWSALAAARDHLTYAGHIVASIPNIRYLPAMYRLMIRGEWTYTQFGILDKTHLRFFTKKSMLEMFDQAGYEVLHIEGIYPSPHWQIKVLGWLLPSFVNETKYLDYAIVARLKAA
jgi:2-polyprenyl-3-methyl-5-hydroxy-6-metoxy-1,4-benzoquinol methylase